MNRLVLLFVLAPLLLNAQTVWFEDRFDSPTISESWNPTDNLWVLSSDGMHATSPEPGLLLGSSFYLTDLQPFRIEAEVRGPQAGIFFALDDAESIAVSQLIRLDNGRILSGFFTAAASFVATASTDSVASATAWIRLRVDFDPEQRRCVLFVDDHRVGQDTAIMFRAGYLGLHGGTGTTTFRSIRVTGTAPQEPMRPPATGAPVRFNRVRFVRNSGSNVQIYNPEIGYTQTIRPNGTLQGQSKTYRPPRGPLQAMAGNRIYEIGRSFLLVKDTRGHVIDTVRSHLIRPAAIIAVSKKSPHRRSKEAGVSEAGTLLLVADGGARAIVRFSGTGEYLGEDRASVIGGFRAPRGLDVMPSGEIVVADYDRLIFRNIDAEDALPRMILGDNVDLLGFDSYAMQAYDLIAPGASEFRSDDR